LEVPLDLTTLKDFLEQEDVEYKDAGERIYLKECFECGNGKWKVSFKEPRNDRHRAIWGICFRCSATFSSYRYLVDLGFSRENIKELHGFDVATPTEELIQFAEVIVEGNADKNIDTSDPRPAQVIDTSRFISIKSWPNHPASLYAKRRGVPEALYPHVMIDPDVNAVVFLCIEDGKPIGWQKRFVNPYPESFKTLNPPADVFKKSQHIIEYPNSGSIVVCEGPFTGVAAWNYGYHAIVTFGSGISLEQIAKIEEIATTTKKSIYVSFDLDAAGFKGFFKIKNYFNRRGVDVLRLYPNSGNDLNDAWMSESGVTVDVEESWDSSVPVLDIFSEVYRTKT